MQTAFRLLLAFVAFLPVRLFAGEYVTPKPIVTPAELAAAAAEVPVMRLDFTLSDEKAHSNHPMRFRNVFLIRPKKCGTAA